MNTSKASVHLAFGSVVLALAACSGGGTGGAEPKAPNDDTNQEVVREALKFSGECTAATCGEVPPSSKATKPECAPASGACTWSDPDPNGSVSYRVCEEKECGTKPDASVCPSGTTFKGAQCGSENEAPCVWTATCAPPRSTTPCPDANGCGDGVPALGVLCSDGTTGGLACMKVGSKCAFQPTCD